MKIKTHNSPFLLSRNFSVFILLILLPGFFSEAAAQAKPAWNYPASANTLKNPLAGNTSVLKEARILYLNNCAPCHGKSGKGDGIAAAALNPKPADHTSDLVQKESDGAIFWKMSEGHTPMPAYKSTLTVKQRWELVNYIRSLAKHK
ncbi:MAG: c-type cytochrome [Terrimonas sp.]|nr:c-type cytochrome [Terrimonas sp.]